MQEEEAVKQMSSGGIVAVWAICVLCYLLIGGFMATVASSENQYKEDEVKDCAIAGLVFFFWPIVLVILVFMGIIVLTGVGFCKLSKSFK